MAYSWELHHIDEKRQDDPLKPICNSSVPIQDVAWKFGSVCFFVFCVIQCRSHFFRTVVIRFNHTKDGWDRSCTFQEWHIFFFKWQILHSLSYYEQIQHKKYNTRHDWVGRWFTGNCARDYSLTMQTNNIFTN